MTAQITAPSLARALPADTTSEAWRHECEVRHVASLPSDDDRRLYLAGVHENRGKAAWQRLRADVWSAMRRVA